MTLTHVQELAGVAVIDLFDFEFETAYLARSVDDQLKNPYLHIGEFPVVCLVVFKAIHTLPYPDPALLLASDKVHPMLLVYSYTVSPTGGVRFVKDPRTQRVAHARTIEALTRHVGGLGV
tara:strand:- start:1491 stop:1850 length:360 start_codon:yes stop_codon:yes gene_type:complete